MPLKLHLWTCVLALTIGGCTESHTPDDSDGDADADADADVDADADTDADGDGDQPNECNDACADALCCPYRDGILGLSHNCTDLTWDQQNCGVCGNVCGHQQGCQESECTCWAGDKCGLDCFDLSSDPLNCGGCGTVCPPDLPTCRAGSCLTCEEAGMLDCGGICVRAEIDDRNCGDCGIVCGANTQCVGGQCVAGECEDVDCVAGSACCDHVQGQQRGCADMRNDPYNCGGCGSRCLLGEACVDGGCGCSPWQTACDDDCVDLTFDPSNCGECGSRCDRDHPVCSNGECEDCDVWGGIACGGRCVQVDFDTSNCGDCGVVCAADEVCNQGNCQRAQ